MANSIVRVYIVLYGGVNVNDFSLIIVCEQTLIPFLCKLCMDVGSFVQISEYLPHQDICET